MVDSNKTPILRLGILIQKDLVFIYDKFQL